MIKNILNLRMLNSDGPFPTAGKVSCALVFTPTPKSITKSHNLLSPSPVGQRL